MPAPALDIGQAMRFLDLLGSGGRHTIASEHPFGGPIDIKSGVHGPRWLGGETFETEEREALIQWIEYRQRSGANVYYSVNRPVPAAERVGAGGKNNADDISAIRALVFDVDFVVPRTPD
jgi:hypothetical protein